MMLVMALVANMAMAQQVVTFTAGTEIGKNTTASGKDEMSKDGVTITTTAGGFNCVNGKTQAGEYRFGKSSVNTFTSTNGSITKIVITSTTEAGAEKYGPDGLAAESGSYTYEGKIGTWTGNATSVVLTAPNFQTRATKIEVTVASNDPDYIAAPVISGDETFQSTTTVTITAGEGTQIYYTVNGDDPTDDRAERTLYTAPFTLSQTTTVQAAAFKGEKASAVSSKTFTLSTLSGLGTLEKPYTIADVISLVSGGTAGSDEVYVAGIVSQAASSISSYGDINFYLSDNGAAENEVMAYNSKYFNKENYTDTKQLPAVGDKVVLCGKLTKYNDVIELGRGNYLVSLNGKTAPDPVQQDTLTFTASEALAALKAGTQPTSVCYITGTICEDVDTSSIAQYGNLSYKISDDGTATNALTVFRGKSFEGQKFTKDFFLKKGDEVKILGLLINYTKDDVTTPEVQSNNQLVSVNGQTAGVNVIKTNNADKNAPLYNLAGQRVSKDYKGVVIQNGKKFFNLK